MKRFLLSILFVLLAATVALAANYVACVDQSPNPTYWWFINEGSSSRLSDLMVDDPNPQVDCNGANNANGWADLMTEHLEDKSYEILLALEIGDGSTTTALISTEESVCFAAGVNCEIQTNATVTLGEVENTWGRKGTLWLLSGVDNSESNFLDGGTIYLYNAQIIMAAKHRFTFNTGNVYLRRAMLGGSQSVGSHFRRDLRFQTGLSDLELRDVTMSNFYGITFNAGPDVADDIKVHDILSFVSNQRNVVVRNALITDATTWEIRCATTGTAKCNLTFLNPKFHVDQAKVSLVDALNWGAESYAVDIQVKDPLGDDSSGVAVDIIDKYGNRVSRYDSGSVVTENILPAMTDFNVDDGSVFSPGDIIQISGEILQITSLPSPNNLAVTRNYYGANYPPTASVFATNDVPVYIIGIPETDVNGVLEQQVIMYKSWVTTSEDEKEYTPHVVKLSKPGVETLILENQDIDEVCDWRFEVQYRFKLGTDGKMYEAIEGGRIRKIN